MTPLLLLFAIRVNPADPDLVAGLQGLAATTADVAAAPAQPVPAPQQQPPAPRDRRRARWGAASARGLPPPPISSLRRWRPALVRTRTADGRLVITDRGEGSGASGGRGLICTRRRERDGQGHLTMSLI